MKAFIFDTQFRVVSAWADHGRGLAHLMSSKPDDRLIFWAGTSAGMGYRDRVCMLNAAGQMDEIKIMPELIARLELGIKEFKKGE